MSRGSSFRGGRGYRGHQKKATTVGIDELRQFQFKYGTLDQSENYEKARKGIAEYAGTKMDKDMWRLAWHKEEREFEEPTDPGDKPTPGQMEKYKMELKIDLEEKKNYRKNKGKLFRLLIGQCRETLRSKLESLPAYSEMEEDDDVIALLVAMEKLVYSTSDVQDEYWVMQASMKKLVLLKQDPNEELENYSTRFLNQVKITEGQWGPLIPSKKKGLHTDVQVKAKEHFLSRLFLAGVDKGRYRRAIDDLSNDHLQGVATFPEDVPAMLKYLSNRRGNGGTSPKEDAINDGEIETLTSFAQRGERRLGQNLTSEQMERIDCWKCGKKGHFQDVCPGPRQDKSDEGSDSDSSAGSSRRSNRSSRTAFTWTGMPVEAAPKKKKRGKPKRG